MPESSAHKRARSTVSLQRVRTMRLHFLARLHCLHLHCLHCLHCALRAYRQQTGWTAFPPGSCPDSRYKTHCIVQTGSWIRPPAPGGQNAHQAAIETG